MVIKLNYIILKETCKKIVWWLHTWLFSLKKLKIKKFSILCNALPDKILLLCTWMGNTFQTKVKLINLKNTMQRAFRFIVNSNQSQTLSLHQWISVFSLSNNLRLWYGNAAPRNTSCRPFCFKKGWKPDERKSHYEKSENCSIHVGSCNRISFNVYTAQSSPW